MPERIPLLCLPEGQGWYEADGLRVRFGCTLPGQGGVCKVWIVREGRRLLLGTPEPEGDALTLRRTVSRAMLQQQGVFPPRHLEVVGGGAEVRPKAPPEPGELHSDLNGWQSVAGQESRITRDDLLRAALRRDGWFWRREGVGKNERICLRCRWQVGEAFPIPALFCLTRMERGWLTLWLDGAGRPLLPP